MIKNTGKRRTKVSRADPNVYLQPYTPSDTHVCPVDDCCSKEERNRRTVKEAEVERKKKYRELTMEDKSSIFWLLDNEGLGYGIQNYLEKECKGTELEPYLMAARKALDEFEEKMEELGVTEEAVRGYDEENDE